MDNLEFFNILKKKLSEIKFKEEIIIVLLYFGYLFILDYLGTMDLYEQNFVRRLINMARRRDPLTYQKKLKPFCIQKKKY